MSLGSVAWRGRRKRLSRRVRYDLRTLLPIVGLLLCFASSATVIAAAERAPRRESIDRMGHFKISSNSTSKLSAAPAGIRPVLRSP